MQPAIQVAGLCKTCLRLRGEPHQMRVVQGGIFCDSCKKFIPHEALFSPAMLATLGFMSVFIAVFNALSHLPLWCYGLAGAVFGVYLLLNLKLIYRIGVSGSVAT